MITFKDIVQARTRIRPYVSKTPLLRVKELDEFLNCKVYIKPENFQTTGSFKLRGATNKIESLTEDEKRKGVVAASSGNHAQGVASAAKRSGIDATIVMPEDVNPVKLKACQKLGAEVILHGHKSSERAEKANELVKQYGMVNVHPYSDKLVKAGQGTIALEILEDNHNIDMIVAPVGGGGLISGLAVGAKGVKVGVQVVGVEPKGAMRYARSLEANKPISLDTVDTIADGTRTDKADEANFQIIKENVDFLTYADDEEIKEAIDLLIKKGRMIAEPSSVMGIAAAMKKRLNTSPNDSVCFVLSGGNNDLDLLAEIISK